MIRRTVLGLALAASLWLGSAGPAPAAAGDLDPEFGTGGTSSVLVPVPTWLTVSRPELVALPQSGKLLTAAAYPGDDERGVAVVRYTAEGGLDAAFGSGDGVATIPLRPVFDGGTDSGVAFAVQPDGRIVVATTDYVHRDGVPGLLLARLEPDGGLDETFGTGGLAFHPSRYGLSVVDVALQSTGRILVAQGENFETRSPYGPPDAIRRFEPDGRPDETFSPPAGLGVDGFLELVVDGQDRILAGNYDDLRRLQPDGAPDPSFAGGGSAAHSLDGGIRLGLQPGGGVVVAGTDYDVKGTAVVRLTEAGTVDPGFGGDGKASILRLAGEDVAFAADGSILVSGGAYQAPFDMGVARLSATGCVDLGFGGDGLATADFAGWIRARTLAVQPSGRIVAADLHKDGSSPEPARSFALAGWQGGASTAPGPCEGEAPTGARTPLLPATAGLGGFGVLGAGR